MKYIVLLFFILIILILTSYIEIDIKKLEIINKRIKFNISIKVYILKYIKIFTKKIRKKDIVKFINFSSTKNHIRKEKKIYRNLEIEVPKIELNIKYGIRHIFSNIYLYGIINSIVYTLIANTTKTNTKKNINIQTDFKENKLYLKIETIIRINTLKTCIKIIQKAIKPNPALAKNIKT